MFFALFVFFLSLAYIILPVSLDCPILIAPSVFSNVYLPPNRGCNIVIGYSVVDRGFESRSGKTKDYAIGMCCFCTELILVDRKSG